MIESVSRIIQQSEVERVKRVNGVTLCARKRGKQSELKGASASMRDTEVAGASVLGLVVQLWFD